MKKNIDANLQATIVTAVILVIAVFMGWVVADWIGIMTAGFIGVIGALGLTIWRKGKEDYVEYAFVGLNVALLTFVIMGALQLGGIVV